MRKSVKEERIAEIYEAALKVFAEKGFTKATLDEIAEKINITKPALYFYFKSKDDLFFSLIKSRFLKLNEIRDNILNKDISPLIKLKEYIYEFVRFFKQNKNFFYLLMNSQNFTFKFKKSELKIKIKKNMVEHLSKIKSLMDECISAGYLKKRNSFFLVFALQGLINQILFHSLHLKDFFGSNKIKIDASEILKLFLEGAGTEKSKEEIDYA